MSGTEVLMRHILFIAILLVSGTVFALTDPIDSYDDNYDELYSTSTCKKEQLKSFKKFIKDKKKEFKSKMNPSKNNLDCDNFPYYKIIKEAKELESGLKCFGKTEDKQKASTACELFLNYCNGKPQFPDPENFGDDVEVWFSTKVVTCGNIVTGLTMNRDECKEYFGLGKPTTDN